jgi:F-type H+-transporting ATPase subunit epsilon
MSLVTLEVVTPRGGFLREEGCSEVVMRRREIRFDPGSEVAVFPAHGPMVVRLATCDLRYIKDGRARHVRVHGGFAEVKDDVVTVLTPQAERPAPEGTGR